MKLKITLILTLISMKTPKLFTSFIASSFTMIFFLSLGLVSCETETIENNEELHTITVTNANTKSKNEGENKIDICHYSEEGDSWKVINVSQKSWSSHLEHGDFWLDQDKDGYTAYNECGFGSMDDCDDSDPNINPENGCNKIFAIAYSNLNGQDGYQENSADVLISKLIDFNNDGIASTGDKVITDRYPLNFEGTAFGEFTLKEHIVGNIYILKSNRIAIGKQDTSPIEVFDFLVINGLEFYREGYTQDGIVETSIIDAVSNTEFGEGWGINANSPSKPEGPFGITTNLDNGNIDNTFIDVDIFID